MDSTGLSEARIHFELHRHLENAIEKGISLHGVTFARSEPEYTKGLIGGQSADIVIFDKAERPWLVIEAKRKVENGYTRDFDPYSPKVIQQAQRYAQQLGAPFFATFNGDILVLFKTFEEFKPLLQSKTKSYKIINISEFAGSLLEDIIELRRGKSRWDSLDDAFIRRIQIFHERITPLFLNSLNSVISYDVEFRKEFTKWVKEQGFDIEKKPKEVYDALAKQAAYILVNQLLFYKILESSDAYHEKMIRLKPVQRLQELPKILKDAFQHVIKNIDFKAVFEQDEIFSKITMSETISGIVNEFIDELHDYDLTIFSSDVIGRIYEGLIPSKERHDLGQYYTPPPVVDLITRLCVKRKEDTVLDPACGSGGFLVRAYKYLSELHQKSGEKPDHVKILKQIYGIDINKFPAHLSAINLAIQDISKKTDNVQIEVSDFFDVDPSTGRFARRIENLTGKVSDETVAIANKVSVIVANPPYIKSGKVVDKDKVRKHLPDMKVAMELGADIYAYFFTHATEFLQDNGRLGFITSDKWLDTHYGKQLAKFLFDNYKIKYLVKFDKQIFEDALIGTIVTVLQKEKDSKVRDSNVVNLVRLKSKLDINTLLGLVESKYEPETVYDTSIYRIVAKKQSILKNDEKWLRYLYAPNIYFEIITNQKITNLGELADIVRGKVTGANEFFYLQKEDIEALGLKHKFFKPIMKAIAQAKFVNFKKEDTEWFCLDLHNFIENEVKPKITTDFIKMRKDQSISGLIKEVIKNVEPTLYQYILQGEEKGYDKTPTTKNRKVWFDLGELDTPTFIFPDVYWKKTSVPFNSDKILIDKQLYALEAKKGIDMMVLGGLLNSDFNTIMRELHGRTVMGEALNRNQVTVGEALALPIVDIRKLSDIQKERISKAFRKLIDNSRIASASELEKIRHELNKAVMAAIGLENKTIDIEEAARELLDIRIRGGGAAKDVMVRIEDEKPQVMKLKGAKVISSSSSLDNFV